MVEGFLSENPSHQEAPPGTMISGYFYKDDPAVQAALEQRLIHGFIEKPFSHAEVIEMVKDAFSSREAN